MLSKYFRNARFVVITTGDSRSCFDISENAIEIRVCFWKTRFHSSEIKHRRATQCVIIVTAYYRCIEPTFSASVQASLGALGKPVRDLYTKIKRCRLRPRKFGNFF